MKICRVALAWYYCLSDPESATNMMLALVLAIANSPITVLEIEKRVNLIHHTALFSILMLYPHLTAAA
jgi:hypothetical protein